MTKERFELARAIVPGARTGAAGSRPTPATVAPAGGPRGLRPTSPRRQLLTGLAALAVGGVPVRQPQAAPAPLLTLAQAAVRLAGGGHVLMIRHARTESGVGDPPGYRLDDCASQRNLSADGRAQAQAIGRALREAGVLVGEVRSSAWCRCRDTAQLAFGAHTVWSPLNSFFDARAAEREHTGPVLALIVAQRAPANRMLVTHQVNITAASGVYASPGQIVALHAPGGAAAAAFTFDPLG